MTLKNDSTKHNWRHPVLSGNNLAPDNSSVRTEYNSASIRLTGLRHTSPLFSFLRHMGQRGRA